MQNNLPARVVNLRSNRRMHGPKIKLDQLVRSAAPKICIKRCLAGNTRILLANGLLKPINLIDPGDVVINRYGQPTKVLTKTYSGESTKVVKFRSRRMTFPITCTLEHKVLVLDLREKVAQQKRFYGLSYYAKQKYAQNLIKWLPAEELGSHTYLLTPRNIQLQTIAPKSIDLTNYLRDSSRAKITDEYIMTVGKNQDISLQSIADELGATFWQVADVSSGKSNCTKPIHKLIQKRLKDVDFYTYTKRNIPIGYKLGKFFGLLLGDGSKRIRVKNGHISGGEITIAVNSDYWHQVEEIQQLIHDLFGRDSSLYTTTDSKCIQITFFSLPIAQMLSSFGTFDEKQLPPDFLFEDDKYLRGLLNGLVQSDGHGKTKRITNSSPFIISLAYWLFERFGYNPKISVCYKREGNRFGDYLVKQQRTSFAIWPLLHQHHEGHQRIKYNDIEYDLSAITEKEIIKEKTKVWDIGVENGTSFIAENVVVHNSLGGIGDVLMTTPLLKQIKNVLPNCILTYATDLRYADGSLAQVIQHNPYVDRLISWEESNGEEYDYSIDITQTGLNRERPGTTPPNRIDLFAEAVGVNIGGDPVPTYIITPDERKWARKHIKKYYGDATKRKDVILIAIQARSNDARRTWPKEYVNKLADMLGQTPKIQVLLFDWGGKADQWDSREGVHAIANMKTYKCIAILEQVDLVICPDSSVLHMAGALHKKTLGIFGPIPPESRINHYENASAITLNLPCQYCFYSPKCVRQPKQKLSCLNDLKPKMVYEAAMKKLEEEEKMGMVVKYGRDLTTSGGGQDPIILVRRTTPGIGDLLMATPGIEALKRVNSNKQVHVAVDRTLWPVLKNNPHVDKIIDANEAINYKRYFMTLDISSPCAHYESTRVRANKQVEKSRVEIYAEAMGVRNDLNTLKPSYYPTKEEIKWARQFLKNAGAGKKNRPKLFVGIETAEMYRSWPAEKYPILFQELKDRFNVIITASKRTENYEHVIDACGFPVRHMAAIMSQCDGVLTADTSLVHFAAALDIPCVALFGPIDYRARCKGYKNVIVMQTNYNCIPCWRNAHMECKKNHRVKGYSVCMDAIKVNQVISVLNKKFL